MPNLDADEQAALNQLGADEKAKADQSSVATGPGIPESPSRRIQTGAIDAAEAAEQLAADSGDDFTKNVNESGKNVPNS